MKVLLVNGSPHREGCTYTALLECANTLNGAGIETEIFWIGAKPVGGCIGCGSCRKTGVCIFDDAVNAFAAKAKNADAFIFGSPVHYASAAGNMIGFMDRLFYSAGAALRNKPAAAISSARRAGTTATYDQMNKYFGISEMPIVSSGYWNMVHGSSPEEVKRDEEGMQTMRILAKNMAYLLKCIEAGKAQGVPMPEKEPPVRTNFIR